MEAETSRIGDTSWGPHASSTPDGKQKRGRHMWKRRLQMWGCFMSWRSHTQPSKLSKSGQQGCSVGKQWLKARYNNPNSIHRTYRRHSLKKASEDTGLSNVWAYFLQRKTMTASRFPEEWWDTTFSAILQSQPSRIPTSSGHCLGLNPEFHFSVNRILFYERGPTCFTSSITRIYLYSYYKFFLFRALSWALY